MEIGVPILVGISMLTSAAGAGAAFGVMKSKINTIERDMNNQGKRFDDKVDTLKDDYINQMTLSIKEGQKERHNLEVLISRMEEKISAISNKLEKLP